MNGKQTKTRIIKILNNRSYLQAMLGVMILALIGCSLLSVAAYSDYVKVNRGPSMKQMREYYDENLDISFQYPEDWSINTAINLDSSYEDPDVSVGKIPDIAEFELILEKPEAKLRFVHFFGESPSVFSQINTNNTNYEIIGDNLIRIQSKDLTEWFYHDKINCEFVDVEKRLNIDTEVCYSSNYSGFLDGVNRVRLTGRINQDVLEETDRIVISAALSTIL